MLSYAFTSLDQKGLENIDKEEFDNIHSLFAAILTKGIGRQLKQGLYKEYLGMTEDIPILKGRIDIEGSIRNASGGRKLLSCEHDELSENNLFNKIIKTAALLLIRSDETDREYKDGLKKALFFFSDVESIAPASIRWGDIKIRRENSSYRLLLGICQLIFEGMLQTTESGDYRLEKFVDRRSMERLYEKFILEYYIKHYPDLSPAASRIAWSLDDGYSQLLPVMQSDVTLTKGDKVLIIDAKYYAHMTQTHFDIHTINSSNLYQIFAYVKNKDAEIKGTDKTVSGMLLYARTDEDDLPDRSYNMSGNKISVCTLDLAKSFQDISGKLDQIAIDHFGCH